MGDTRIIVALDAGPKESRALAASLAGDVTWLKVGMTLFYEAGPEIVRDLVGSGFSVFVDLKLHDIPHQVEGAARALGRLGVGMLTVHASGGSEMVAAAVKGAREGAQDAGVAAPAVLAVTVLTSLGDEGLASIGVDRAANAHVPLLARLAIDAGADGIVCSPREAREMRGMLGDGPLIVTPGVRPQGSAADDQKRTATPAQALRDGASHLVVGRPITGAPDARVAAAAIIEEIQEVAL